ncbi:7b3b9ddd-f20b-420e-83ae-33433bcc76ff [Thermothielavioides terrestris]|uniref:7b3b9ddd-f20b-420e-83ae-33433bcc76ff n=1 Tax=Thermothielavioides terrestris TaxID=2587410 RepID=A0A3S4F670_9PEZI|nr:7b3b9ddd-f20b-420e-83ae-33433bcc76ff [Thermothielavioides terrestris]
MARLAVFAALLGQLQPALATFYTVTSYYALSTRTTKYVEDCTECDVYTYTSTLTLKPTVTPTARPISSDTDIDTYEDVEIVSVFVPVDAVPSSDILTALPTPTYGIFTDYAVPVTWTAPASCPTAFTVVTYAYYYPPYEVTAHLSPISTATSLYTDTEEGSVHTHVTYFLASTAVPSTVANTATNVIYTRYVERCINPTAGFDAVSGGGDDSGSGGGGSSGSDDDDDWDVCSAMTGCVRVATYAIVLASVLPAIFLLGFVESYFWFRRLMLGKSALRLGTICWCCISLWVICMTQHQPARSPEDQVLLRQYWDTLSAGTRLKYWFRHGFRWRYPVELLGNPNGNNPAVVPMPPPPPPGGADGGDGAEKMPPAAQAQPVYVMAPYPGQQQPAPGQNGYAPAAPAGFVPAQGYGVPVQYMTTAQPGVGAAAAAAGQPQTHPGSVPSPSPVSPSAEQSSHTTPPPQEQTQQPPPPGGQPQELPLTPPGGDQPHELPHSPPAGQPPR